MPSDQQHDRTTHTKAPGAMFVAMGAALFGMMTGYVVGTIIGYPEPLSVFGLFAPIVVAIIIQLDRIHTVKHND